jgi:hypothetical protein
LRDHPRAARIAPLLLAFLLVGGCATQTGGPDGVLTGSSPGSAATHASSGGGDAGAARTASGAKTRTVTLVTESGLPGESYPMLAPNAAWSWFGDPRAVRYQGVRSCTYAGWVTAEGDVVVAQFDHDTGEITSSVVAEQLQRDDHAAPTLLVRPDGRIMAFYSGHRGRWLRYRISKEPEDVSSWGDEHAAAGHTSGVWGYTYPCSFLLSGEADRRYLFWRGRDYLPMMSTSENGMSWSSPIAIVRGEGEQPYVKYASDGVAAIHIAFTDDHPGNDETNNIYYARYEGGALHRADGSVIAAVDSLPISPSDADLVYDAAKHGARAWLWDVACDELGRPVIAYAVFPSEEDHRYRYARWNGSSWIDGELTPAGARFPLVEPYHNYFEPYYSGGMALDHSDPSVVYVSRPVSGVFEIERWVTPDEGITWSHSAVTAGSKANNVRPVAPVGHADGGPEVIWMHGLYVNYVDYNTDLRMK